MDMPPCCAKPGRLPDARHEPAQRWLAALRTPVMAANCLHPEGKGGSNPIHLHACLPAGTLAALADSLAGNLAVWLAGCLASATRSTHPNRALPDRAYAPQAAYGSKAATCAISLFTQNCHPRKTVPKARRSGNRLG